jgi:hypothetical protein
MKLLPVAGIAWEPDSEEAKGMVTQLVLENPQHKEKYPRMDPKVIHRDLLQP